MPPQQPAVVSQRRSLETSSVWALAATLIVSIFIFLPTSSALTGATKAFVLVIGTLVTLVLFILARLSRGNIILPPLLLVGALWLPAIAYALSAAFSGAPTAITLWGVAFEPDTVGAMLTAAVLGTLTAFILRKPEQYEQFLKAAGYVFGVFTLAQIAVIIVGQLAPSTINPAFSLLTTIEDEAYLLGLGVISILLTLRFLELSSKVYRGLIIMAALALFLLAITGATIVWTMVGLVALGLFVEAVMQRGPRNTDTDVADAVVLTETTFDTDEGSHSLVLPLVVLAVSLFFLISSTLSGALASALHVNVLTVRPSWQATFSVAHKAYDVTPVFGSGPGTFGTEWLKYRDPSLNYNAYFWNTDFPVGIGFIPTSFVTTGLVGGIAWLIFFALLLILGIRMLVVRAPQEPFTRFTAILSFVATVYLFVNAVFGLPSLAILILAFVFAGVFISTMRFAQGKEQWGIVFSRSPRLGFVVVFLLTIVLLGSVMMGYTVVERYLATAQLVTANARLSAGDLNAAKAAATQSVTFTPTPAAYQVQAAVAGAHLTQIIASTTMPVAEAQKEFQTNLLEGTNAALTATRLNPADYQSWVILGNLYAQAVPLNAPDAYESAKQAYKKAQALNPTSPQIPFALARLEIAHKDSKAAKEDLKQVITLKQDYIDAIFLLSQLEVQDGNVKEALAASLAANYYDQKNPNILFQIGILYAAQNDLNNAGIALTAAVQANPQFANARYFLAAIYAKLGNYKEATNQLEEVAKMSADNEKAVAPLLVELAKNKNPFPANLLSFPEAPVSP